MKKIDINEMALDTQEKISNVLYDAEEFKVRIIKLPADGKIPDCNMPSYVMFYVVDGSVDVMVDQEKKTINEGQCLISEPASLSMRTTDGVKIMGIQ
ncbi:MAG: hypothetical protein KAS16_05745, partial [Thermoplasmata archaeon]|nr:hypothetical protein [Thermoplasmata archaeon]